MGHFIDDATLRAAVQRLGTSRSHKRLGDYLVFRRAIVRTASPDAESNGAPCEDGDPLEGSVPQHGGEVVSGTRSTAFVRAVEELARCVPCGESWDRPPYYVPFAALRDSARGYRSPKYISNGSDNTAAGWQNQTYTPLRVVPDARPREWRLNPGTASQYEAFLLVQSASKPFSGEKPRILDAACWWSRFRSFDTLPSAEDLVSQFVSDLDIDSAELSAIFTPLDTEESNALGFADRVARPERYLPDAPGAKQAGAVGTAATETATVSEDGGPTSAALDKVLDFVTASGFTFEPWQIAAFITAIRTKPFVILAGISGTGKSKLPSLVAQATGSDFRLEPVQSTWTDSSDLIGYERLDGKWVPGHLLLAAQVAHGAPDRQHFFLLDEMNLARVEYYFAEVLSLMEARQREGDRLVSPPLAPRAPEAWAAIYLPENLSIIGTVNMDETTFGFSRKVLDRSFVIEFSSVDLSLIPELGAHFEPTIWPAAWWRQSALTLAEHPGRESSSVARVIDSLEVINAALEPAQLQVGYRARDEIAMYCLNAEPLRDHFVTRDESPIDPLDLAITMKVLPRIQGSGPVIREVLTRLLRWADGGTGGDGTGAGVAFPKSAERLRMMQDRLDSGFTSYWL